MLQTGSGKTHTMLGDIDELGDRPNDNRGMTPRIFEYLFSRIQQVIKVEIYGTAPDHHLVGILFLHNFGWNFLGTMWALITCWGFNQIHGSYYGSEVNLGGRLTRALRAQHNELWGVCMNRMNRNILWLPIGRRNLNVTRIKFKILLTHLVGGVCRKSRIGNWSSWDMYANAHFWKSTMNKSQTSWNQLSQICRYTESPPEWQRIFKPTAIIIFSIHACSMYLNAIFCITGHTGWVFCFFFYFVCWQLREDSKKGVYVENLTETVVRSVQDVVLLLMKGASNRKVASTNMNRESSRSHSVFTCSIESKVRKARVANSNWYNCTSLMIPPCNLWLFNPVDICWIYWKLLCLFKAVNFAYFLCDSMSIWYWFEVSASYSRRFTSLH